MHHGGAERMLGGGAGAAAADRVLHRDAVEFDVAADGDVVDRDAGVLAEQVVVALGDGDVLDEGCEHEASGLVGLALHQHVEAGLDVVGQQLQRADIERLRQFLDFLGIEHAWLFVLDQKCKAGGHQQHRDELAEATFVEPAVDPPSDKSADEERRQGYGQQHHTDAVERHQPDHDQGSDLDDDDEGLIDAARLLLRTSRAAGSRWSAARRNSRRGRPECRPQSRRRHRRAARRRTSGRRGAASA